MPTHITVTAPEGRKTPIHTNDGTDPSGHQLTVEKGRIAKVRYSQDVRRSINRGDLIPCDLTGKRVESIDDAEAPVDFEHGSRHPDDIAIEMANRRHRQADPEDRPPLPDETGPQTDRRRNLPAPSPWRPLPGPPDTQIIPREDEPLQASAGDAPHNLTTTDASRAPAFDTTDTKTGKGR